MQEFLSKDSWMGFRTAPMGGMFLIVKILKSDIIRFFFSDEALEPFLRRFGKCVVQTTVTVQTAITERLSTKSEETSKDDCDLWWHKLIFALSMIMLGGLVELFILWFRGSVEIYGKKFDKSSYTVIEGKSDTTKNISELYEIKHTSTPIWDRTIFKEENEEKKKRKRENELKRGKRLRRVKDEPVKKNNNNNIGGENVDISDSPF